MGVILKHVQTYKLLIHKLWKAFMTTCYGTYPQIPLVWNCRHGFCSCCICIAWKLLGLGILDKLVAACCGLIDISPTIVQSQVCTHKTYCKNIRLWGFTHTPCMSLGKIMRVEHIMRVLAAAFTGFWVLDPFSSLSFDSKHLILQLRIYLNLWLCKPGFAGDEE